MDIFNVLIVWSEAIILVNFKWNKISVKLKVDQNDPEKVRGLKTSFSRKIQEPVLEIASIQQN